MHANSATEAAVNSDAAEKVASAKSAFALTAFLVLALGALYFPELSGRAHYFMSDHCFYFQPFLHYMGERLRQGELPLWNPYLYCGMSQIAVPSPGVFYPFTWLFALDYSQALALFMLCHQVIAGLGAFLLISSFRWGLAPAVLGAIAFAFCGYMFSLVINFTLPASAAWLPLLLWSLRSIATAEEAKRPHRVHQYTLIAAISWAMMIACGRPEISIPGSILAGSVMLIGWKQAIKNGALKWQIAVIVIAGLLNAPVVLPVVEWMRLSPRAHGLNLSQVMMWSACWYDWLCMVFVQPFGDLQELGNAFLPLVTTRPVFLPYVTSAYVGPFVATLAIWGLMDTTWRKRWLVAALLAISVVMTVGEYWPIAPFLVTHITVLSVFRYPIKWIIFPLLCLAICAARGLYCIERTAVNKWAVLLTASLWLVANLAGMAFLQAAKLNKSFPGVGVTLPPPAEMALALALLTGCALGIIACVMQQLPVRGYLSAKYTTRLYIVFAAATMLFCAARTAQMTTPENFFDHKPFLLGVWNQMRKEHPGPDRLLSFLFDPLHTPSDYEMSPGAPWTPSFYQYTREVLLPNTSVASDVPQTFGYEAAETGFYRAAVFDALHASAISLFARKDGDKKEVTGDLPLYRLCEATATHWLSTQEHKDDEAIPLLEADCFKKVFEDKKKNIRLYEVKDTMPRAYFTPYWKWIYDQSAVSDAVADAYDSNFDPACDTWINRKSTSGVVTQHIAADPYAPGLPNAPDKAVNDPQSPDADGARFLNYVPATVMVDQPEHVSISVIAKSPGFVVLTDHFYPGWQALVDGVPKLTYKCNLESRAVYVGPGSHLIEFNYEPDSLKTGLLLASIGGLFLLFLLGSALTPWTVRSLKRLAGQS
ncbi:MAG TPA: hypothetical protein V6C81_19655 [Planktothrix sp.]